MTNLPINNHTDLKNEILRLQGLEREKGAAIQQRFSSPGAIFSSVFSLFGKGDKEGAKDGGIFNQDFLGVLSRFAIPFALNKTLFRNSNFIIKALVGLVSQKASHYISEDSVETVWDKAKGLLGKVTHLFDKEPKRKSPEVTSFRMIKKD
ncbi:hypothetical protein [Mucilaginibacter sp. UR6-11]|uniref:hypothetical protein n=1 Tax=Mucilaginibacter sp. UR6-11 TaxID=1435644 RepID=UPI001E3B9BE4|nr:hypothetical protein [Mucilaginibacter sp. UR6-11]MCC8424828.1 hypothetical protein [Mucilaginibacter sp. UR6-11]